VWECTSRLVISKTRSRCAEGMLHSAESARRIGGVEPRSSTAEHQDSTQGAQGRLAPVRAQLLPPLSPGRAPSRAGRHFDEPCRLPLRVEDGPRMSADTASRSARIMAWLVVALVATGGIAMAFV